MDKPAGWTSHDVVNKVRRFSGERSVGHLGTLDPLATGVLPLLLGPATRLARFYGTADKVYEATVRFGFATTTYDAEGDPTTSPAPVDLAELESVLASFRGSIQQIPPAFSAKKVRGVAAYKRARRDEKIELAPVNVEVYSADLINVVNETAELHIHCSSGTYVRSIAHDIGKILGCGGHLTTLRRTRSGDFTIAQARTIEQLESDLKLIPAADLLPNFPTIETDEATTTQIRHGRDFRTNPFRVPLDSKYVKAFSEAGDLIAIGEALLPNLYHPTVVLTGC